MKWVDWKQYSFQTLPESYSYAFALSPQNLCMSPVGVSSEDRYSHVFGWGAENSGWTLPDQEIIKILVEEFKQVPQVKSICAHFGPEEITIWTLLENYNRDAREKVYEKELGICQLLRIYDFDFRVTSIDIVSPDDLVHTGSHQIYRR
jgi:hypothetical protein